MVDNSNHENVKRNNTNTQPKKYTKKIIEENLQAILNGIGDSVTIQDKDLDIIWINKPTRDLWGDVIGKKCYEVYKGLSAPCTDCYVEEIFKKGKSVVTERPCILPDGRQIDLLITSSPVRDSKGNIIAIVEVEKDITERKNLEQKLKEYTESLEKNVKKRKQLELQLKEHTENLEKIVEERTNALSESEEKMKGILSGIGDLITIQNKDLDIIWANKPMQDIYGEIIGKKCYKVYKGLEDTCPDCTAEKVFNEGLTLVSQRPNILPDGSTMQILTTSSPIRDANGEIVAVVEMVKDITERKKLERQLKDYTKNLEKVVEERTNALKESEEKLKALLRGIGARITIQNKDLDIIWINQSVKDIFGDITGKKCYEAYKGLTEPCSDCYAGIVFNEGKTLVSERSDTRPDGNRIQTLVTSSPVRDAEGNIVSIVEVTKDITERKKLERQLKDYSENLEKIVEEQTKSLKESEEKLQGILTGIGDRITIQNKDLDIIWANKTMQDEYGEIIGEKCYKVYKGLEDKCPNCTVEMVLNEGRTVTSEGVIVSPEGRITKILTTSSPMRDAKGNIVAVVEVIKDITERKKLETALKESERRYRGLYESSINGIVYLDLEGRIVDCNQAFANMLGYTKEELYNFTSYDITPSKWLDNNIEYHTQLKKIDYSKEFEKEYFKKDGSVVPVAIRGWSIKDDEGKQIGTWGIVRDITERKRAEKKIKEYTENLEMMVEVRTVELRESEERFRSIFDNANEGILITDLSTKQHITGNLKICQMLGYTLEELKHLRVMDVYPKEDLPYIMEQFEKAINREITLVHDIPVKRKDGGVFYADFNTSLITLAGKAYMLALIRDITESKWAEELLRESEERYRGLYDSSRDGIAYFDINDNILECNQAFTDMLGYNKEELYKLATGDLVPSKWAEKIKQSVTEQTIPRGYSDEYEIEGIKKDGTIFPVSIRSWLIVDEEGKPIGTWAIVRDITERKKVDQMKSQFVNLAAHELRTPLSALKAHVELLDMKSKGMDLPEDINRRIGIIMRNAKRLAVLINNLLDYTRLEAGTMKIKKNLGSLDVVVSQVVNEVIPLATKHNHELSLHTPEMLPLIQMDKEMIRTVFNNLISNAIKYTPDGGKIEVIIREDDDQLHATVKDTGIGIAEEDIERIFHPFHVADIPESVRFKTEFERTGLGLAIIKEYVKMHGGYIWVESQIGEGSSFHVILPID